SKKMSGEPTDGDPPVTDAPGTGDVIPLEVVPPDEVAPPDRVAELEAKVAGLEKEAKDNRDRHLRAAADLENHRKRSKRQLEDAKLEAKGKVLKEMLPVVDNLERAIEHAAQQSGGDEKIKPIIEGVQLVLRQFVTAFERLEV